MGTNRQQAALGALGGRGTEVVAAVGALAGGDSFNEAAEEDEPDRRANEGEGCGGGEEKSQREFQFPAASWFAGLAPGDEASLIVEPCPPMRVVLRIPAGVFDVMARGEREVAIDRQVEVGAVDANVVEKRGTDEEEGEEGEEREDVEEASEEFEDRLHFEFAQDDLFGRS